MTLTLAIPSALWLTANRNLPNRGHRARIVRDLHQLTILTARQQHLEPHAGPVIAAWEVRYPKGVGWEHGDPENSAPTAKACIDALVIGRWLLGDGPRHVIETRYRRGPNLDLRGLHAMVLTLTDQETS